MGGQYKGEEVLCPQQPQMWTDVGTHEILWEHLKMDIAS